MRVPLRSCRSVRFALLAAVIAGLISVGSLPPRAIACSLAVPNPNTRFLRFTGKAIAHELTMDSIALTYRWTFTIRTWDKTNPGKRRKIGSKIFVSVVENRKPSQTTTLAAGTQNSCSDIKLGVDTEFTENRIYRVTAAIHVTPTEYYITSNTGILTLW